MGAIYRPHCRTNYQVFMDKLEHLSLLYKDIVICGDFNNNVFNENLFTSEMLSFGLKIVNNTEPTHFTTTSNSLIDLFFVSCKHKILLYDQLSAPMFSKHDLCFLTFDFQTCPSVCSFTYRDFKNIDYLNLHLDLMSIEWDTLYSMVDIDEQIHYLQHHINFLYNKYVPLRTKIISSDQTPWFDNQVKTLIDQRNRAYARWKI